MSGRSRVYVTPTLTLAQTPTLALPLTLNPDQVSGRSRVYVSPDGMTRFSTIAKVQRWHRQQLALASRFQQQQQQQVTPTLTLTSP